jgi:DNA-binding transcriptional MerR regulator
VANALTIGQVSKATGVTTKTIRYYEDIGVLPPPRRTATGYRQYDQPGVRRLHFIRRARALGLPLEHLKALTSTLDGGARPALRPRLLGLIREQLAAVQRQIADLQGLQQQLEQVANRLLTSSPAPPDGACRCLETEHVLRPRRRGSAGSTGTPAGDS